MDRSRALNRFDALTADQLGPADINKATFIFCGFRDKLSTSPFAVHQWRTSYGPETPTVKQDFHFTCRLSGRRYNGCVDSDNEIRLTDLLAAVGLRWQRQNSFIFYCYVERYLSVNDNTVTSISNCCRTSSGSHKTPLCVTLSNGPNKWCAATSIGIDPMTLCALSCLVFTRIAGVNPRYVPIGWGPKKTLAQPTKGFSENHNLPSAYGANKFL